MSKTIIVDLGTGNLHSVKKAVEYVSSAGQVSITNDPATIRSAHYLILPGQGAIGTWFTQLKSNPDLEAAVRDRINDGPCLGICLGLQALFEYSEESGGITGLNVMEGSVKHFSSDPNHRSTSFNPTVQFDDVSDDVSNGVSDGLDNKHPASARSNNSPFKIPHMGWNEVIQTAPHPLWHNISKRERFYFVHSYYVQSTNQAQVVGQCEYGNVFTAAAAKGNLFATQFHPEKSQHAGLQLLRNFVNWNGGI